MKKIFKMHQSLLLWRRRTISANKSLGRSLAFIAGAINSGGFMVVNQYTSHMTGILSLAADDIALKQWFPAVIMLFYIACFICGSATSAALVMWARSHKLHSQYALPITLEALLLTTFGIINATHISPASEMVIVALLCYLMGLQNAVITKISKTAIRTTHVTGMITDIGIEFGKMLYALIQSPEQDITQNKDKISLHVSIALMFLLGGVLGAYGFKYIGFLSVIPLAGYLLFLAVHPIRKDIILQRYLRLRLWRRH